MPETILGKVCMTPKGEYSADTAYEYLDIVTYEGTSYIVLKGVQGITPPNAEYYSLLAEKGVQGATGPKGDTGATGQKGEQGENGESAYEIAVKNGFEGTEQDWLNSLQGQTSGIAAGSISTGIENLAGAKAFNIVSITYNGNIGWYDLDSVEGLAVGDVYSVHLAYEDGSSEQFENVGEITEIVTEINRVVVNKMANTPTKAYAFPNDPSEYLDENGVDTEINTFRIVNKPLVGTRTIGCVTTANGYKNKATSKGATANGGTGNLSFGSWSHTTGKGNKAGYCADAGGNGTEATGFCSFTRGSIVKVLSWASGAIGNNIILNGLCSFLTGQNMQSTGKHTFGFGFGCNIDGNEGMVGGNNSEVLADLGTAIGDRCSVEGNGNNAFVIGLKNIANSFCQFVRGKYNIADNEEKYVEIVGNGTDGENRSNAYTLDWHGNGWFAGEVTVGPKKYKLINEDVFNNLKEAVQRNTDYILKLKYENGLCLIEGLDGMGTEEDPVLISTPAQWEKFVVAANADKTLVANGKHYKLAADLDFEGYSFTTDKKYVEEFYAHLDGDGHKIYNFTVGNGVRGLIYQTFTGSVIENIGMVDTTFTGVDGVWHAGIVGRNKTGTIKNCYMYGIKDGGSNTSKYGGLVGQAFWADKTEGCTIENCYVVTRYGEAGYIDSTSKFGGLIAEASANTSTTVNIKNAYTDTATLVPSGSANTTYKVINSYYVAANTTAGTSNSTGGYLTANELKNYAIALGSAFADDIYNINSGYPVLVEVSV